MNFIPFCGIVITEITRTEIKNTTQLRSWRKNLIVTRPRFCGSRRLFWLSIGEKVVCIPFSNQRTNSINQELKLFARYSSEILKSTQWVYFHHHSTNRFISSLRCCKKETSMFLSYFFFQAKCIPLHTLQHKAPRFLDPPYSTVEGKRNTEREQ